MTELPLDERDVDLLEQATLKGWVIGSESWLDWCARQANRRVSPLPRGRPRKPRGEHVGIGGVGMSPGVGAGVSVGPGVSVGSSVSASVSVGMGLGMGESTSARSVDRARRAA